MNTVYVVEHGSLLKEVRVRGNLDCTCGKHQRKDQLIDKILIRAFDLNDRSAAAASPSSLALWA